VKRILSLRGTYMSGVGIGGTIFSMFCGICFMAFGIWLIVNAYRFDAVGIPQEFCLISSILLIGYGVIMILVGRDQIKGIKEGKEYDVPGSCLWP
jgi:hypothetical protein